MIPYWTGFLFTLQNKFVLIVILHSNHNARISKVKCYVSDRFSSMDTKRCGLHEI